MTPRQRILATLDHEPPDRTPVDGWFHPEVVETLKAHFRTDDWEKVLAALGIEGWAELPTVIRVADYESKAGPRPGHADGQRVVWLNENTFEDIWGVRFEFGEGDRYQRWLAGPLQVADPDGRT